MKTKFSKIIGLTASVLFLMSVIQVNSQTKGPDICPPGFYYNPCMPNPEGGPCIPGCDVPPGGTINVTGSGYTIKMICVLNLSKNPCTATCQGKEQHSFASEYKGIVKDVVSTSCPICHSYFFDFN